MPSRRTNKKSNKNNKKIIKKVDKRKINKVNKKKSNYKYKNINLELINNLNKFEKRKYLMSKIKCNCTDCNGNDSIIHCNVETYLDNHKINAKNKIKITQV